MQPCAVDIVGLVKFRPREMQQRGHARVEGRGRQRRRSTGKKLGGGGHTASDWRRQRMLRMDRRARGRLVMRQREAPRGKVALLPIARGLIRDVARIKATNESPHLLARG